MDREAFLAACAATVGEARARNGIGTLGEKTLHAALKRYFEPDPAFHEVNCGPFVADIRNDRGFVEVQTRQLHRLREKLELFLTLAPVTVVYPVPAVKRVIWVDETGELSPPRAGGKRFREWELLPELYGLQDLVGREGLEFRVLLLEVEDYRLLDGRGPDRKKGATRLDRMPVDLLDELILREPEDFRRLIPRELGEGFTVKEFGKAARLKPFQAGLAVKVLADLGAVARCGQRGRAYLYTKTEE